MKPNIFAHATKELSQDAFFAWLLEWADYNNQQFDHELHDVAKDFVRFLLDKEDYVVSNVLVLKQWQNMDITVTVNNEYFIVIEDKTNTGEHSSQLERYAEVVRAHDKSKNLEPVFIYLKTGNESHYVQQYVKRQGFRPIDRKSILEVFRKKNANIKNSIFTDFVAYMKVLEQSTNACQTLQNITTDWKAAEGFYMSLESKISDAGWGNVSNQSGGFLGLWYHGIKTEDCKIYIQIENTVNRTLNIENRIRVVLKISEWDQNLQKLYTTFEALQIIGLSKGLQLVKPNKFRVGATSTIAVLKNAFSDNEGEIFIIDDFVLILKSMEETLDTFVSNNLPQKLLTDLIA